MVKNQYILQSRSLRW